MAVKSRREWWSCIFIQMNDSPSLPQFFFFLFFVFCISGSMTGLSLRDCIQSHLRIVVAQVSALIAFLSSKIFPYTFCSLTTILPFPPHQSADLYRFFFFVLKFDLLYRTGHSYSQEFFCFISKHLITAETSTKMD